MRPDQAAFAWLVRRVGVAAARSILWFAGACVASIVGVLLVIWALGIFDEFSAHGVVAIILGISFTVLVGAVLMGLIFYSDRSAQDEAVYRAGTKEDES